MPIWIDWLVMLGAVTYLVIALTETDGPLNVFERLRNLPYVGKLFECPICASFWIALLVQWLYLETTFLVYALALAGNFVVIGRMWDKATVGKRQEQDRERIAIAEELVSSLMALSNEDFARVVMGHYLSGVDLGSSIILGMSHEKQEPAES
jgi:hypothetical protein